MSVAFRDTSAFQVPNPRRSSMDPPLRWPNVQASTCTSLPPRRPGLVWWSARFAGLTEKQVRRGVHRSPRELEQAIRRFVDEGIAFQRRRSSGTHGRLSRPRLFHNPAKKTSGVIEPFQTHRQNDARRRVICRRWSMTASGGLATVATRQGHIEC